MPIFATNNGRQIPIGDDDATEFADDEFEQGGGDDVYEPNGTLDTSDYTLDTDVDEDVALKATMLRAEERLVAGNYYNALIQADLFAGDDSPIAVKVQARVRQLVRGELEEMLGLRAPARPAGPVFDARFSDADVQILKLLIEKMKAPKVQPSAPAQVQVAQVAVPAQQPPAPIQPKQPKVAAVAVKPPAGPQPQKAPAQPAKPKPAPQQAKPQPQKPQRRPAPTAAPKGDASNEQVKGVRHTGNGRMVRKMRLEGEEGSTVITQDLTPQVITPMRIPMPTGMQMTSATMAMAMETVGAQGQGPGRAIMGISNTRGPVSSQPLE